MSLRLNVLFKVLGVLVVFLCLGQAWVFAQSGTPQENPTKAVQSTQVNINQASAAQLEALPGIGTVTAKRIVEFRQKNGPFKRVEDLLAVRGIGEKILGRMKSRILL